MKHNKGFSLVECVVAIAVISIITASAIGIFHTALNSANSQWNRYLSTVMADNALACFQSSDSMSGFETRLSELSKDGNVINNSGDEVWVTAKYNELVMSSGQATETSFSKIRADNKNKKVTFYKDNNNAIFTIDYSGTNDNGKYNSDVTASLKNSGYYDADENKTEGTNASETLTIAYTRTGVGEKENKGVFTISGDSFSVTSTCGGSNKANQQNKDLSTFDKYLLGEGYYIVPFQKDSENEYVDFYVMESTSRENVLDSGNKLIYRIYANWENIKNCTSTNYTVVKSKGSVYSVDVTKVEYYYYGNSNFYELKNNNKSFTFDWQYFSLFYYRYVEDNSYKSKSTSCSDYTAATNGEDYTDYTLKSEHSTASKISYELKSSNKIELYGAGNVKLYSYSGSKISDVHNSIVTKCVFVKDNSYSGASGTEKYAPEQTADGIQLTAVNYDEANKKIKFMNGATEVISFDYNSNATAFNNDKPTANALYSSYYNDDKTIKNPNNLSISVQRIPVNNSSYCYQISLINADGTQTAIFSTSYGIISTNQSAQFDSSVERTKTIQIDGSSYTQYYYYIPPNSNVGCYIMVTYSKVSTGDTSVEPRIKAWILSKSDIDTLKANTSNKSQNEILQRNSCYISYRKG